MNGKWKKGPGEALFEAIQKALGEELPIFAEDLGIITPEVEKLRDTLGFPGMKILQFGFDGTGESTFLPHQLSTRNCCLLYTSSPSSRSFKNTTSSTGILPSNSSGICPAPSPMYRIR